MSPSSCGTCIKLEGGGIWRSLRSFEGVNWGRSVVVGWQLTLEVHVWSFNAVERLSAVDTFSVSDASV